MNNEQTESKEGLLPYYRRHGISPVRYRLDSVEAHFDRRDSLYRSLGLPPMAFRGNRVLEVAVGSGQNSLYVASCQPGTYDLVEPNTAGIRDIRDTYAGFYGTHTAPTLHEARFENYQPQEEYDIVICENWLGSLPSDLAVIRKLATLLKPGGVFVVTCVPVSGFFPNIMRKLLALRLTDPNLSFEQKTEQLVGIFSPHLATITDMTRSHRDWVHDTMLLPAYLDIALPLETLNEAVGDEMEILATFPRFTPDWRWFKSLVGEKRRYNEQMIDSFQQNLHNFIDYRKLWPIRSVDANARLDAVFRAIHEAALMGQTTGKLHGNSVSHEFIAQIGSHLSDVTDQLAQIDRNLGSAVAELKSVWEHPLMDAPMVRDMTTFSSLFGRETVYVSFTRLRST
jgi:SAM-dependent methyltransferase